MKVTDSIAIVSGAASGIGLATVSALIQAGARGVVMADIDEAALHDAAEGLSKGGATIIPCVTDVADIQSLKDMYAACLERFGTVDIVFNNAGIVTGSPGFPETSLERTQQLININVAGVIISTQIAVSHMKEKGGSIVNTASTGAFNPNLVNAPYSTSKAAVVMFSQSCKDLKSLYNINVNAICPGITETPILTKTGGDKVPEWLSDRMQTLKIWTADEIAQSVIEIIEDDNMFGEYKLLRNPEKT